MDPTEQQQAVIAHDWTQHARVLAGPGTGKSVTAVALAQRLRTEDENFRLRFLTFTRAATAELARKLLDAPITQAERPSTVHSFSISALLRNPGAADFPEPLRIPDDWEQKELIWPELARLVGTTPTRIEKKFIPEMAAMWESLVPEELPDITADERARFAGAFQEHRWTYGYTLLAELPDLLRRALEEHEALEGLDYQALVIDEYQDLNACDLRVFRLLGDRGVSIIAIGDDDQSIYSFRKAAPEGIRRFCEEFETDCDYPLTMCHRLPVEIIAWSGPIRQALDAYELASSDPEAIKVILAEPTNRRLIVLLRLLANREDSLAWRTLFELTAGIGQRFHEYIYARARASGSRFGRAVVDRAVDGFDGGPRGSADRALDAFEEIRERLDACELPADEEDISWTEWIDAQAAEDRLTPLGDKLRFLFEAVEELGQERQDLSRFVSQVAPVGKDLAQAESAGVRFMSMASSKGLTVRATFVVGVEQDLIPRKGADLQEERRLLYVAMTRSTERLYLTYATRRYGPQQFANEGSAGVRNPTILLQDSGVPAQRGEACVPRDIDTA